METHRAKLSCQWFQCGLRSSSSRKNKLKEPLMDSDDSSNEFDFNDDELEVVDILFNLPGNFLERLNLETSSSAANSTPSADQEQVSKDDSQSKKETKKPVNQKRNNPSAVNSGLSAEQVSNKNSKKTVDSRSKKESKKPVSQERNSPSAVNLGLSADQEWVSNKNAKRPLAQWILCPRKNQRNQSTKNSLNCHKISRT
ncbi:hypothetical protein Ahy_B10g102712 [Arachis hypogaea]|uniref:Uncharacterized protein n=1 Tax=Arachis hypogaea TaxID=3818 RepID=A0A444X2C2_ARAHY|nr:hypothetical protein Ahy_B10g102712 [Arachis hypogaea]